MKNYSIERVNLSNADDFISIMREFHYESMLQRWPYSADRARRKANLCIDMPERWFGSVAISDTYACGAIAGYASGYLSTEALVGTVEGVYVRKGTMQKPLIANELLRLFTRWAISLGSVALETGVLAGIDELGADIFYRRNGFTRTGIIYGKLVGEQS